jgi:hypothetical protein
VFSFLQREVPAVGRVLYPGTIPPSLEQLPGLGPPVTVRRAKPTSTQLWAIEAEHPSWGTAEIGCERDSAPLPDVLIDHTLALSDGEKARARLGAATVALRVLARQKHVLKDRKRMLFWLRALMQPDGVLAVDGTSMLLWSPAMLDDELAHDAPLDVEALYTIHAVLDESGTERNAWLHTHGLEEIGAFDIDVLSPSPLFASNPADPFRALAFAALEGAIAPDTDRFMLAHPRGDVRLVSAQRFQTDAAPEHQKLRSNDPDHSGRRAVLCEPVGGLFGRWRTRPSPSRFISRVEDGVTFPFSKAATELTAERAAQTMSVLRHLRAEFESLDLPALVKLGYETDDGGPGSRENLWFEVHNIGEASVDATLVNAPHHVPSLQRGQRGEFDLGRLTDWAIMSPTGQMTPRNISAARRLREDRPKWQAVIDAAKGDSSS